MVKKILVKLAERYAVFLILKNAFKRTRDNLINTLPIDSKLIVFESFRSTKYADSPRAIYEYLLANSEFDEYRFVWSIKDVKKYSFLNGNRTKVVKFGTLSHKLAFARAKYWIVNGWIPLNLKKREGQIALQCWHGTPFKRIRYDIISSATTKHKDSAIDNNDAEMIRYDYIVSPSRYVTEITKTAFNLVELHKEDIIIETGYPRNDILSTFTSDKAAAIRSELKIPKDKKIILYTPTWREDIRDSDRDYSLQLDLDALKKSLGDEWILLVRLHYLVADTIDYSKYKGFVYNVSDFDDISPLYVISDVLMTDYSSTMFDYAILKRPMIFYMYDLDHYKNNLRGFYFGLDELPGDIVQSEVAIGKIIHNLPAYEKKYKGKYAKFNKKFDYLDDGKATKRVVDRVFNISSRS